MFIKTVKIKNILGIKDKFYNLDRNLILITGANGVGKSTIFEAITIALFGKGIRNNSLSYFLGNNGNSFSAEVEFEHMGEYYQIIRTYTQKDDKGSTDVTIYKKTDINEEWKNITPKGNVKSQNFINSIIGLDYDSFVAISLISSASKNILFETGGEILKQMTKILDIELVAKIKENIKDSIKSLEATKKILLQKKEDLKIKKQNLSDIQKINNQTSFIELDEEFINTLISQNTLVKKGCENLALKNQELVNKAKEIEELKDTTLNVESINEYVNSFDIKIQELNDKISNKKTTLPNYSVSDKIQEINNRISFIKSELTLLVNMEEQMQALYKQSKDIFDKYGIDVFNKTINPIISLNKLLEDTKSLENKKSILEEEKKKLTSIVNKKETSKNNICPTCGSYISESHYNHILEEINNIDAKIKSLVLQLKYSSIELNKDIAIVLSNKDKRVELKKKIEEKDKESLNKELKLLEEDLSKQQAFQQIEKEISELVNDISKLSKKKENAKILIDIIKNIEILNTQLEKDFVELKKLIKNAIQMPENVKTYLFSNALEELTHILSNEKPNYIKDVNILKIKEAIDKNKANKEIITKNKGIIETLEKDIKIIQEEIKTYEEETRDLPMYKETLKLVNILPNYALFTIAPTLEKITNEILEYFEDSIKIKFEINTEITDNNRNAINLFAIRNGSEIPIFMLSSGQQSKVNFSFKFAMSALLSQVLNKKTSLLFIDEGFGSLDKESRTRLSSSIKNIHEKVEQVFIITHINDVQENIINDNQNLLHIHLE